MAGVHLLDPKTDTYNSPFLPQGVRLVPGYGRMQGVVYRPGDERFEGLSAAEAVARAVADPSCHMVNRTGERHPGVDRRVTRGGEAAGVRGRGEVA